MKNMIKNMIIGKLLPIIIFIGVFFAVSCIGESYKEILSERLAWLDDCTVRFKESGSMLIEIMR